MTVILKITLPITLSVYVNRIFFSQKVFICGTKLSCFYSHRCFCYGFNYQSNRLQHLPKFHAKWCFTHSVLSDLWIFFFHFYFYPIFQMIVNNEHMAKTVAGLSICVTSVTFLFSLALLCALYNIPVYYKAPITVLYIVQEIP